MVATLDIAPGRFFAAMDAARVLGLTLLGITALVALSGVPIVARLLGHLTGCRRAAPTARAGAFLHTLSAAVRAGRPLDVALERTADAAGHPRHVRHVRAVRAAARRARDGEAAAAVFTSLPLPGWLLVRAPLLTGPPAMPAESLRELAESASLRAHAAEARFLTLLTPLLLTVTGGVLCMVFLTFFAMLQRIRETALPW